MRRTPDYARGSGIGELLQSVHAPSPRNIYRKNSFSWGLYQFYLFQLMDALPVWLMAESLLYSRSTIRKPYILELSTRVSFSSISHKSARMWSTSQFRRIFLDDN